jgi:hypothetical protein
MTTNTPIDNGKNQSSLLINFIEDLIHPLTAF